jgi:MFS family permease
MVPSTHLPLRTMAAIAAILLVEVSSNYVMSPYIRFYISAFEDLPTVPSAVGPDGVQAPLAPMEAVSTGQEQEVNVGLYVGLLMAAQSFSHFITNILWGYLSDRRCIGRKPIILIGLSAITIQWILVGFSGTRSFWSTLAVLAAMGACNGNMSVCRAMIADLTTQEDIGSLQIEKDGAGDVEGEIREGKEVMERKQASSNRQGVAFGMSIMMLGAGAIVGSMIGVSAENGPALEYRMKLTHPWTCLGIYFALRASLS